MRMVRMIAARATIAILLGGSLLVSLAATIPTASAGGNWPQWQGPNRDAVSSDKGLLKKWPENGPAVLWTSENLGIGMSGVSIQDGRIYTMGERDTDDPPAPPKDRPASGSSNKHKHHSSGDRSKKRQFVIALNEADGSQLWAKEIGTAENDGGGYPGPRCTPAADGDHVYAMGIDGDLACLDSADGKIVWKKNMVDDFGGQMMSGWGYAESPLVDGDRLICTPGGRTNMMVALDKLTGKKIWGCAVPEFGYHGKSGAAYSSIVISHGAGVKQYVQLIGHGLIGVRADDGKFLWGYDKIANGTANIPTPIVRGDYVFDSTGYNAGAALLKLSPDGSGVKADEVYFLDGAQLQNHHGGMVLVGDYLYGGHGHNRGAPICLDFLTGKIKWKQNHGPGDGSAAIGYADGKLYYRYQDGTMALIDCTPKGYKKLSEFRIPDVSIPSWPHPVITGGRMYLRDEDRLLCYKLK
jgi:outer membrane protein assembly factor BamB